MWLGSRPRDWERAPHPARLGCRLCCLVLLQISQLRTRRYRRVIRPREVERGQTTKVRVIPSSDITVHLFMSCDVLQFRISDISWSSERAADSRDGGVMIYLRVLKCPPNFPRFQEPRVFNSLTLPSWPRHPFWVLSRSLNKQA